MGIEPTRLLRTLDFESSASADSATLANCLHQMTNKNWDDEFNPDRYYRTSPTEIFRPNSCWPLFFWSPPSESMLIQQAPSAVRRAAGSLLPSTVGWDLCPVRLFVRSGHWSQTTAGMFPPADRLNDRSVNILQNAARIVLGRFLSIQAGFLRKFSPCDDLVCISLVFLPPRCC